jgi:hypothetical protein
MGRQAHSRDLLLFLEGVRSMPEECRAIIRAWPDRKKSPYSRSFYSCRSKRWDFTPDACERISDHWNFRSKRQRHCVTDRPVINGTHWTHAVYDASSRTWLVRSTWQKSSRS